MTTTTAIDPATGADWLSIVDSTATLVERAQAALDDARARRDEAIHHASEAGASAPTIAARARISKVAVGNVLRKSTNNQGESR